MTAKELKEEVDKLIAEANTEEALKQLEGWTLEMWWHGTVLMLENRHNTNKKVVRNVGPNSDTDLEQKRINWAVLELVDEICKAFENQRYYPSERENRAVNQGANVIPTHSFSAYPVASRPEMTNDAFTVAYPYGFVVAAESQPQIQRAGREPLALPNRAPFAERKQLEEMVDLLQELLAFLPAGERERRRRHGQKLAEMQRQLNFVIQLTEQLTELISRAETKTDRLEKIEALLKKGNLQKVDSILDADMLKQQQMTFLEQRKEGQTVLLNTEQNLKDLAFEFLLKARLLSLLQPDAAAAEEAICLYEESLRTFPQTDTFLQFSELLRTQGKKERAIQVLNDALQQLEPGSSQEDEALLQYRLALLLDDSNEQDKVKQCFETAINIYRQIVKDKPDKERMLAEIIFNYAVFHRKQRHYPLAMKYYHQSLQLWHKVHGEEPRDKRFKAIILLETGNCHQEQEQYTQAQQQYRKSFKLLSQISEKNTADVEPELLAEVLVRLGILEGFKLDPKQGLTYLNQALGIYRKLSVEYSSAYSAELAQTLRNIGYANFTLKHYDLALEHYTESLQVWRKLSEEAPKQYRVDVANILYDIANAYQTVGEIIPAKTAYRESLDLFNALDKENPKTFSTSLASVGHDTGRLLHRQKAYAEAIDTYLDSLEHYREIAAQDPDAHQPGLAMLLWDLGLSYADNGNLDEAEAVYTESQVLYEKLAEKRPGEFAGVSGHLSNILGRLSEQNSKFEQAGRYYQKAVDTFEQLNTPSQQLYIIELAGTINNLALYNKQIKLDYVESERLYIRALNLLRDAAPKDPPRYNLEMVRVMNNLANLWLLQWQTTKNPVFKEKAMAQCAETQTLLQTAAGSEGDLNDFKQSLEEMKRQLQS